MLEYVKEYTLRLFVLVQKSRNIFLLEISRMPQTNAPLGDYFTSHVFKYLCSPLQAKQMQMSVLLARQTDKSKIVFCFIQSLHKAIILLRQGCDVLIN